MRTGAAELWVVIGLGVSALKADVVVKSDNAVALDQPMSWVSGVLPGTNDIAQWDGTVTAGRSVSLGRDLAWRGLAFLDGVGGNVAFVSGGMLTLGRDGLVKTDGSSLTLACGLTLCADQTWSNTSGTLDAGSGASGIDTRGYSLTLDGGGTKKISTAVSGGGTIRVAAGTAQFASGTAADSAVDVRPGATLLFDVKRGTNIRAARVSVAGGTLRTSGDTLSGGMAQVDVIGGALRVERQVLVQIQPNSGGYAQLSAGALEIDSQAAVLFRGNGLGVSPAAAPAVPSASMVLSSPPALSGDGSPGTPSVGLLPGAFGDTSNSGTGMGLVTYDAVYGVRLLDTNTEYRATLPDGETTADNVRLANAAGNGLATHTLGDGVTTVQSLTLENLGPAGLGGGGLVVAGASDATLRLAGGMVYVNQSGERTQATDIVQLTVPTLDFGGRRGVVFAKAPSSNGTSSSPFSLRSALTNDGGEGVLFCGPGITYLDGASASAYTGPTVNNAGFLRITKSVPNSGVPGPLIVQGGTVQNTGNQIPDEADLVINGGSYLQKGGASNSGSGASETFRDLLMSGGSYSDGASGTSSGSTALRNASLSGGSWSVTKGHVTALSGDLCLSGGTVTFSGGDSTSGGQVTLAGALTITNTPAGAYTCMTLGGGSGSANPARLSLARDVAVVGAAGNTNAVVMAASSSAEKRGMVLLNGLRVFDVGTEAELVVEPTLGDGSEVGGLVKTGGGRLTVDATNRYTGVTIVSNGELHVRGVVASPVTVCDGAVLSGCGWVVTNGLTETQTSDLLGVADQLFGVNLAGGEFGSALPGTYGRDYVYPLDANEWDYYYRQRLNLIRVPFKWERVQRTLNGALDDTEMGRLDSVLALARSRRMKVLLDMHNYDRRKVSGTSYLIGDAAVPYSAFRDVWLRIADRYKDEPAIYGYGIMNEPHDTGGTWPQAAQAAVDGIRVADRTNVIVVAGDSWSSAERWKTANPGLVISDPCNRMIYEAHCYFDHDASGTYVGDYDAEGGYPDRGVDRVRPFVEWLREHGARGLIGEYGIPADDARWMPVLERFLAYLQENGLGGTYWAGGPWWGSYALSCEPTSGYTVDRPQMEVLKRYVGSGATNSTAAVAIAVKRGGTLAPGLAFPSTLSVAGDVTMEDGGVLQVRACGAAADRLSVAGAVRSAGGGVVRVRAEANGRGPWLILSASEGLAATFKSAAMEYTVVKENTDTELWLKRPTGMVVVFR